MGVFHLLRHGEHGLLSRVLAGRMPGVGMTERGQAEIASQAERLAAEKIAAIYASPLQRTRESAEIVAARLGLPIEFRDDLIELDFGEWTGATFDSIRADPRWQAWSTGAASPRSPAAKACGRCSSGSSRRCSNSTSGICTRRSCWSAMAT
jgi:probable phosphoglycerate mutase